MFRSLSALYLIDIIFRRSAFISLWSQISAIKFEGKKHVCTAWKPLQHYVWKSCNYICNDKSQLPAMHHRWLVLYLETNKWHETNSCHEAYALKWTIHMQLHFEIMYRNKLVVCGYNHTTAVSTQTSEQQLDLLHLLDKGGCQHRYRRSSAVAAVGL